MTIIPHSKGLVLYKGKKEVAKFNLKDGKDVMMCFLDFAQVIVPKDKTYAKKTSKKDDGIKDAEVE